MEQRPISCSGKSRLISCSRTTCRPQDRLGGGGERRRAASRGHSPVEGTAACFEALASRQQSIDDTAQPLRVLRSEELNGEKKQGDFLTRALVSVEQVPFPKAALSLPVLLLSALHFLLGRQLDVWSLADGSVLLFR